MTELEISPGGFAFIIAGQEFTECCRCKKKRVCASIILISPHSEQMTGKVCWQKCLRRTYIAACTMAPAYLDGAYRMITGLDGHWRGQAPQRN